MRRISIPLFNSIYTALALALFFLHCGSNNNAGSCLTCQSETQSHYVFTGNAAGSPSTVSALTSDATTGTMASITGSPFGTGLGSVALAKSPSSGRLYVANSLSGDISAFTIDLNTGGLNAIAGSAFVAEPGVNSVAVEPGGRFLYAVSGNCALTMSAL